MDYGQVYTIDVSSPSAKYTKLHATLNCLNLETSVDNPVVLFVTKRQMNFLVIYAITAFVLAASLGAFRGEIVGFILLSAAVAGLIWAAIDIIGSIAKRIRGRNVQ